MNSQIRTIRSRDTELRRLVLLLLSKSKTPLSAKELLSSVIKRRGFHKTSVYRQLDTLQRQSAIHEVELGDRKKRYELSSINHHHHIVCAECGTIQDVVLKEKLDKQKREVAKQTKFKVSNHVLEFFGLCPRCQ